MNLLQDKTVLVTGILSRHSIAYAIAKACQDNGAKLIITYQDHERVAAKARGLAEEDFPGAPLHALDAGSDENIEKLFAQLKEEGVELDGLVHSMAFVNRRALQGPYHRGTSRRDFQIALDISAYSFTALAAAAAPLLKPDACLLTLTYLGSQRAVTNYNVMGVAKAALESSVRYLAASFGPQKVRVNAISAGPIKTLAASGIGGFNKILEVVAAESALRRNVSQEEVASAALFLLSSLASGVTGEILHVDAGHNFMLGRVEDEAADADA
ncbi:MAG: enoyl-ACP reductase [Betaproteobacteria bacterium AqS2]|uniref:Enoyl-[acyl-carrier-protein] reductase [NADH] n=1 Tax=Candidatus Amphirhobacter heronislandensis TaxID=1732024 RepID=A0A930Y1C7_9GAMM|nr:enoyl-ACP reductase [Betaproteobacteria bacterium AqS2]